MCKRIAIIGLGLIGGSMAMALKGFEDYEIVGVDRDPATLEFARTHGVADYLSTDAGQAVSTADVVYLCLHPRGIVDFLHLPGVLPARRPGHRRMRYQNRHRGRGDRPSR